jgi:hypothetical protein
MRDWRAMIALVLVGCGVAAATMATLFSYASVRDALAPLVHGGDETRALVDAGRPFHQRSRVRRFARRVTVAIGWAIVAMYGLFLATVGSSLGQR